MRAGKYKGIIFDLDGTIIHSNIAFPKMKRRMIRILEADGVPEGLLSPDELNIEIFEKAEKTWDAQGKPESERVKVRAKLEDAMNQGELEVIPKIKGVEGVNKALKRLREMGYKLAILTRSHHAYAVEALKKIGAYEYFEVVLGRNETPKPKPHAEALEHASMMMGLSLREVVFVGDHHMDSVCASNANCRFIGVGTGSMGEDSWLQNRPENLIESVSELPAFLNRFGKGFDDQ